MGGLLTLAWYNIILLFGIYAFIFSVIARFMKLGHVLGIVLAVALITAYFTREIIYNLLPALSPEVCIIFGFASLIVSNIIVDYGVR